MRDAERPHRLPAEPVHQQNRRAALLRERTISPAARSKAQRPRRTSGALVTTAMPPRSASACSVVMSFRSEEKGTSPTRSNRAPRLGEPSYLRLGDEERCLGGVHHGSSTLRLPHGAGVVGEAASEEDVSDLVEENGVVERAPVQTKRTFGPVAHARSTSPEAVTTRSIVISFFVSVPVPEQITDAEPMSHGGQALHDRPPLGHPLHAEGEDDGEDAGSPSGTAATASETPTRSTRRGPRRRRPLRSPGWRPRRRRR